MTDSNLTSQNAGGGGGGLDLILTPNQADTTLDGLHALGATTLSLDSVEGIVAGSWLGVVNLPYQVASVNEAAGTVEITSGLASVAVDGIAVFAVPLFGAEATLTLPEPVSGSYAVLELDVIWQMLSSSGTLRSNGFTRGGVHDDIGWAYVENRSGYWRTHHNSLEGDAVSITCGMLIYSRRLTNAWSIEYTPATRQLSFLPFEVAPVSDFLPRVSSIIVRGR